jgi:hypothetical protein
VTKDKVDHPDVIYLYPCKVRLLDNIWRMYNPLAKARLGLATGFQADDGFAANDNVVSATVNRVPGSQGNLSIVAIERHVEPAHDTPPVAIAGQARFPVRPFDKRGQILIGEQLPTGEPGLFEALQPTGFMI